MAGEGGVSLRILIVEDDGILALDEEALVRSLGFEVLGPVGHLEDALRIVAVERIDGAILDIHLDENATSYPVAAELENRGIPFLFLTGLGNAGLAKLFPRAAVVWKPFDPEALRIAIKRMMKQS
jgi:DNA-binding response OmpR family regulator